MSGGLIGGIIGAIIGFFVGGGLAGAAQGFAIGSTAGSILFPPSQPNQYGPRLEDLRAQSSEYGRPIPIVYGTVALQGNVIWSPDIIEVATETSVGGGGIMDDIFGQDPPEITTYTYFANFAVALCEGPISGVLRIWAGPEKRLIYNGYKLEGGGTVRVYKGDETQMPDPLIESYLGVGKVPAYRGTAYVVFENYPLENDFNRIPSLTFEVATGAINYDAYTLVDDPAEFPEVYKAYLYDNPPLYVASRTGLTPAWHGQVADNDGFFYHLRIDGPGTGANQRVYLDKLSAVTRKFIASIDIGSYDFNEPRMAIDTVHKRICIIRNATTRIAIVDLAQFASINGDDTFGEWTKGYATWQDQFTLAVDSRKIADVICIDGVFLLAPYLNYYTEDDPPAIIYKPYFGTTGERFGGKLIDCGADGIAFVCGQGLFVNGAPVFIGDIIGNGFPVYAAGARRIVDLYNARYYDFKTHEMVHCASPSHNLVGLNAVYNPFTDRIYYVQASGIFVYNAADLSADDFPYEGMLMAIRSVYADGSIVKRTYDVYPLVLPSMPQYMAFIDAFYSPTQTPNESGDIWLFPVSMSSPVRLSEVVADLSNRAGMTDYDVSALTDLVDGYAIARQTSVRSAIDALRPAYFFDAVESSGIVRFVKRGGAVAATIEDYELGAREAGGDPIEPLVTTRQMEVELPRVVNVKYLLAASEYEPATKSASRLIGASGDESTLELPLVLTDTKAQEIAEVNLHGAWIQRLKYQFSIPKKYAYLEPTDLVVVKGNLMRLTQIKAALKGGYECEAVADDVEYYAPHVVVTETPPTIKNVYIPGTTTLELL